MPTLETAPASLDNILLTQSRVIRASRARVYEAWTDPEIVKQWFSPAGKHCANATMDVRVGGKYRIEVANDAPAESGTECETRTTAAEGSYTKVAPNEMLQFTWVADWNMGEESLVTVSLKDVEGGTEVTIRHERFASEAAREGHNQGWAGCLDHIQAMLEAKLSA